MMLKTFATVAAAAGLVALAAGTPPAHAQSYGPGEQVITNGPQSFNRDGDAWVYRDGQWQWSPRLNVIHSERYSALVQHNPGFREARMRKECGPISDPQLHQQCLDSFAQIEGAAPAYGSSGANGNYGSSYGR